MNTKKLVTIFLVIFLVSCSSVVTPTPTETIILTSTLTPTQAPATNTPTQANTITPLPTATPIPPTSTYTPTPLTMANFNPQLVGVGTHGNMVCLNYEGLITDFDEVTLKANISQENRVLDRMVVSEEIEGKNCFEVVDAKYQAGIPVEVEIHAIGIGKTIQNNKQLVNVGNYATVPFLLWVFGDNGVDRNVGGGFRSNHMAWDLAFSSDTYPNSVGTPIYSISHMKVLQYENNVQNKGLTHVAAYLPDVGLIYQFGHISGTKHPEVGDMFDPGTPIAYIDNTQQGASRPHIHFYLNTTEIPPGPKWSQGGYDCNGSYIINPFSTDPFNDGSNLSTGLWLPETLPDEVKKLLDQGYFAANTFTNAYVVCKSYER